MAQNAAVPRSFRGGFRWIICALLFWATTINYMDRQILGLLAPTLEKEIGWSEREYGHIVTAFQAGMTCLGSVAGGGLSSWLLKRGWSVNASRKTALLACALCVVPVMFAAQASALWLATLLIGLAASAHQGWAANLYTLVSDMFPREAVASVVGLGSMCGSVTAMLFAEFAGGILEKTGSYWSLFLLAGSAYLVALAIMHALAPKLEPVRL